MYCAWCIFSRALATYTFVSCKTELQCCGGCLLLTCLWRCSYIYIFLMLSFSFPFLISFLVQGFLPEALIIPFDGFHYYRKELLAMPDPDEKMYWRGVRACVCVLSLCRCIYNLWRYTGCACVMITLTHYAPNTRAHAHAHEHAHAHATRTHTRTLNQGTTHVQRCPVPEKA